MIQFIVITLLIYMLNYVSKKQGYSFQLTMNVLFFVQALWELLLRSLLIRIVRCSLFVRKGKTKIYKVVVHCFSKQETCSDSKLRIHMF
jgi:hypothetical protein